MDRDAEKYLESGIFNKPVFTQVINCRLANEILTKNGLGHLVCAKKDNELP